MDLDSLARGHTEMCIKRLAGFCISPQVDPATAIRAIELMLDRGWGAVSSSHKLTGAGGGPIELIIRDLIAERKKAAGG